MRTNIMHDQPLVGRGLTRNARGDYQAGEYPYMTNVDVIPDGLQSRIPQKWTSGQTAVASPFNYYFFGSGISVDQLSRRALGVQVGLSGGSYKSLIVRIDDPAKVIANNVPDQWNPGSADWFYPTVAWEYNDKYYMMGRKFVLGSGTLPSFTNIVLKSSPTQFDSATIPTTEAGVTSLTGSGNLVAAAVMKDRVFVARKNAVCWSKATDPTNFTVPDGGFFKIPDTKINHIFALQETLYILCSTGLWAFTYSGDPGTTGVLKQIIDNLHFQHGCSIQGTPVGITYDGAVYVIRNGFADLIVSTKDVTTNSDSLINNRIEPWNKGFIIHRNDCARMVPGTFPNFSETYYYSLETNSLSYYEFKDGAGSIACVNDVMSVQLNNRNILMVAVQRFTGVTELIYLDEDESSIQDWGLETLPGGAQQGLHYNVATGNIMPDGLDWDTKVFRHLLLEGNAGFSGSTVDVRVNWGFNDGLPAYTHFQDLVSETGLASDATYSYRVGIMQRAKHIHFGFSNDSIVANKPNVFRLSSLKIIWTATTKAIAKARGSQASA